ncbi:YbaN family protein [Candidatus Darwinibacter acetoxidans]|jgi:uncharacterized membrane protein YbaN (DUF454 family)
MLKSELKKILLIALGTLALGLGVVGMFLPILPTTPLLLVTAYCYLRSSPALYKWLVSHRVFGKYIRDYMERRLVPRRVKIAALSVLWPSLLFCIFLLPLIPLRLLVASIGLAVSVYIIRLREAEAA